METAVAGHPTLVITGDDGSRRVVELSGRDLRIGRSSENDVVLPDAAKGVSRTHAELRVDGTHYVIVDLQSQNGTWIDGERVHEATIAPGAEIAIGTYRLRVEVPPPTVLAVDDILLREPAPRVPSATVRQPLEASVPQPSGRGVPLALYAALIAGVAVAGIAWVFWPSQSAVPAAVPGTATPSAIAGEASPASGNSAGNAAAPGVDGTPSAAAPVADIPQTENASGSTPGNAVDAPAVAETPVGGGTGVGGDGTPTESVASSPEAPARKAAREAFDAGKKLDAADDWVGALRKYDEARRADASLPGLDRVARTVRDKMRAAGRAAFNRAREYDAIGQSSEALKEYDRAVQWLPADDTNRAAAVSRAEKLRAR